MAYVIKPKRSETAGASPTTSNLSAGEIAMNTTDGALYAMTGGNSVMRFGIVEGSPAQDQVPRYDGTKHVPSLVTIDAAGLLGGDGTNLTNVNALTVNSTGIVAISAGAYAALSPKVATTLYFIL